jgi:hypothetical protein
LTSCALWDNECPGHHPDDLVASHLEGLKRTL